MAQASAQHILVSTEEQCISILEELKGGANFTTLAKHHSKCPSGQRSGGDLGTFGPGQMVPAFDQVIWKAPLGEVQGPVQTDFGWHLILVNSRV